MGVKLFVASARKASTTSGKGFVPYSMATLVATAFGNTFPDPDHRPDHIGRSAVAQVRIGNLVRAVPILHRRYPGSFLAPAAKSTRHDRGAQPRVIVDKCNVLRRR